MRTGASTPSVSPSREAVPLLLSHHPTRDQAAISVLFQAEQGDQRPLLPNYRSDILARPARVRRDGRGCHGWLRWWSQDASADPARELRRRVDLDVPESIQDFLEHNEGSRQLTLRLA
jgi:hypothetical protein